MGDSYNFLIPMGKFVFIVSFNVELSVLVYILVSCITNGPIYSEVTVVIVSNDHV